MSPNSNDAAAPPSADNSGHNVINSIFDTFVAPELERRHLAPERDNISKVVVELDPDRPHPRVQINDQAKIVAHIQATRQIGAGEEVTEADFDDVLAVAPQDVGPNSGYVCFAIIKAKPFPVSCALPLLGRIGAMPSKYDENTKARAVRLVREHRDDYDSEWAAMKAIAGRLGMNAETLRKWVRQAEIDAGEAAGMSSEESRELRELRRKNRELEQTIVISGSMDRLAV